MNAAADTFRALRQRLKVDMRGEIGLARRPQRVGIGVPGDRLQCIAQAVFDVTVVEDQRRAVAARAPAEFERDPVGAPFEDRAFGRLPQAARQAGLEVKQRLARQAEAQIALGADLDDALVPAVGLLDRLMHRQRIDEFVGDDEARAAGDVFQRRVPKHRHVETFQPLLLQLLQCRADLDQMQHDRLAETLHHARRAQGVEDQRPAPRSELDEADVFRCAHLPPHRGQPYSDQLAEHLADLGRGDEVAVAAQRIAVDVIAVLGVRQAQPHIVGDGHRPGGGNEPADFAL